MGGSVGSAPLPVGERARHLRQSASMSSALTPLATWKPGATAPAFAPADIAAAVPRVREQAHVVRNGASGGLGVAFGGEVVPATKGAVGAAASGSGYPLIATLPALFPEWLGDRTFLETHRVRFPYATGPMANGIATSAIVIEMARAGMIGFFGSAGLVPDRVEQALVEIETALAGTGASWGSNLIHSPQQADLEDAIVDLYLRRGVTRIDASAFMRLTRAVVRYSATGLTADAQGRVVRRNHVLAKISRPEVARRFLSPAPADVLAALASAGRLTQAEADLAARVPLAGDVTVESDSGGHTDNRPLGALFPTIAALRDEIAAQQPYATPPRLGAAGGLGTPASVASAFGLGAAYVMTGSVNQACVESGLSEAGRRLLAEADIADVIMAPAADMFEMGVKVQVLRRGSMFAIRGAKLYEVYSTCESLDAIPQPTREKLEKEIFRAPLESVWQETRAFFAGRDPREVERAEREPKHKMALVFRWYLGKSSRWAITGDAERKSDYQIWAGPAMGAFNAWAAGTFLGDPEKRTVAQVARNLLEGATVVARAQQLRCSGVPVPANAFDFRPRPLA
jgi:trans-AT polyketide synthase, acyltransferase and oxidoreductase domains